MKTFLFLAAGSLLVACGSNNPHADDPNQPRGGSGSRAQQLIAQSDCLSCHKVNEPLVGPSYIAVAQRYSGREDAVLTLAGKIIKGGAGSWGQTPMTPHPALSQEDAEEMARYILTLK